MPSGVQFSQILATTTTGNFPTTSAVTYTTGINAPGGPVEFLVVRGDIVFGADPALADMTNLVDTFRIILNGEVVTDFRAGYAAQDNNGPGLFGYMLNSIGGRAYEDPLGTTTREFYWGIPIGRQTPSGVNRWEIVIGWAASASSATPTSGSLSFWLKTNTAMKTTTTIVPSTSFVHSASLEQVVVRIPQNVPGVVSAIMVSNDSASDGYSGQGIRINSLGSYGLEPTMWRWLNGDLDNGIAYADNDLSTTQQTYATAVKGCMVLPCFGLAGGDIVLQVDSSEATTRTYQPIITNPIGAKSAPEVRQTQKAPGSTSQTILKRTEN